MIDTTKKGTGARGFASMNPDKQREIASKGGRAAHAKGTAHEFTPDEAREAGRKGGEKVSRDREHMASIGREGGHASHGRSRSTGSSKDDRGEKSDKDVGDQGNRSTRKGEGR